MTLKKHNRQKYTKYTVQEHNNRLIIIGNGMASNRLLEALGCHHPYGDIVVFSEEQVAHYNRIMLSPLLAGDTQLDAITPHDSGWYQQRRIQIKLNRRVAHIDSNKRSVICDKGEIFHYRHLVVATGSTCHRPNIPGAQSINVIGFRELNDVNYLHTLSTQANHHVTVIGGGLLGVEAAVGLRSQGLEVTLLHRNNILMNRQLDQQGSDFLKEAITERGVKVYTDAADIQLHEVNQRVAAVSWKTRADLSQQQPEPQQPKPQQATQAVIFATGVIPNKTLGELAGLACDRGILVDERMRTSDDHIYALGECCQFESSTYGLVAPIWDQVEVLAAQLLSQSVSPYQERQHLTKLKVSGLDVHSVGQVHAQPDQHCWSYSDPDAGIYKKVIVCDNTNTLMGALCVGDVNDSQWYFDLLRSQQPVSQFGMDLVFGEQSCLADIPA